MALQTSGTIQSKLTGVFTDLPWRLLSFAAIIFGFSLFIYLGMLFGYIPYLNNEIKKINSQINSLNQSIDENQQKQLLNFYSQLVNIDYLLKNRKPVLSIFDLIEKNTYQSVHYSDLRMNAVDKEIKISGTAPDYETFIRETALLNNNEKINKVILENISKDSSKAKNEVKFTIRLILN
ncbi:hypothetical protein HZB04_03650 [Candidatus Wolfebacteria bacterium]|nr:hypothetical protein [Candidatus Wolfebacteria bacterium]